MCARTTAGPGLPLRWIRFLPLALVVNACTLVNQPLPNEAPVLQASQVDTTRVRRGGTVSLLVQASDEDDDPLEYRWSVVGLGSPPDAVTGVGAFTDTSSTPTIEWIAPDSLRESKTFALTVTISDRQPDTANDSTTFLIEVTQSAPTIAVTPTDTTVFFRLPTIVKAVAVAEDPDGDFLAFSWKLLEGEGLLQQSEPPDTNATLVPLFPGDYLVAVETDDNAATASAEIHVHVEEPIAPDGGSVTVDVAVDDTTTRVFEIDVYEYPGRKGSVPQLAESWFEAVRLCSEQGKRLCSSAEWQLACQGPVHPSSIDDPEGVLADLGRESCNTDLAESGSFPNCGSPFGVYDLIGNAREWLMDPGRVGVVTESSVLTGLDRYCGISQPLVPLPPEEEFDILSQVQSDSLLNDAGSPYSGYGESGIGFRCCR